MSTIVFSNGNTINGIITNLDYRLVTVYFKEEKKIIMYPHHTISSIEWDQHEEEELP